MEKHVILGEGRLSQQLQKRLGNESIVLGRNQFNFPFGVTSKAEELLDDCTIIWNTIGSGSVGGIPLEQTMAHITLSAYLMEKYSSKRQIHFSSNYAQDPFRSFYASTKWMIEQAVKEHKNDNIICIRLANLFGEDYGIIYKLVAMIATGNCEVSHCNINPTCTNSLASSIVNDFDSLFKRDLKDKFSIRMYGEAVSLVSLALDIKQIMNEQHQNKWHNSRLSVTRDLSRPAESLPPEITLLGKRYSLDYLVARAVQTQKLAI